MSDPINEPAEIIALRRLCQRIQQAQQECDALNDKSTPEEWDRAYGYMNHLIDKIDQDDVFALLAEHDRLKVLVASSAQQHRAVDG